MADQQSNLAQVRGLLSHSHSHGHGHHHHHDTEFLTSSNKSDPGVRITRIGLYVNLGMAIAKFAGGYAFNSKALTADAVHSLTDLISDFTTLATISYSLRSPSVRFPSGYGKIESLGALGVSGILLSGGIMIGMQAVMALCQQFFPELAHVLSDLGLLGHGHGHGHSHSHSPEEFGPNINAAWLAGGSILIKEWLYRSTLKIAKEKKSSVLASNAYHHRVDSLTAFVALATIIASHFLNNASWLDPVGGLIISGMIVQAGFGNTKNALLELADVGVDDEIRDETLDAVKEALSSCEGDFAAYSPQVQGMKSGQNFLMDVSLNVPGSTSIEQTKAIEEKVRAAVTNKVKGVKRVSIRFATVESGENAFAKEFVTAKPANLGITDDAHDHDHEHDHDHDHSHGHSKDSSIGQNGSVTKRK